MLRVEHPVPDYDACKKACDGAPFGRVKNACSDIGFHCQLMMVSIYPSARVTARARSLDPYDFMKQALERIPHAEAGQKLDSLLPWNMDGFQSYEATGESRRLRWLEDGTQYPRLSYAPW